MGIFNNVGFKPIPKTTKFDLSREYKTTIDFGDLVPVYLEEVVPGDSFRVQSDIMLRMMPLVAPIMHRVKLYMHFFFVPNRIVFDDWEDFITGGEDGDDTTVFPVVALNSTNVTAGVIDIGSIANYFGIPPIPSGESYSAPTDVSKHYLNALPFRGYHLICNEYYRDQDLQDSVDFSKSEGIQTNTECQLLMTTPRKRCYAKDYFTSARPDTQKGQEISLESTFSPDYLTQAEATIAGLTDGVSLDSSDFETTSGGMPFGIENLEDPQSIDMGTINNLRSSIAIQAYLEKMQRGGSRYTEVIKNFFDEVSDDARLQRPEYLGGGVQNIVISEVLNTSDTANADQGAMAGHGISLGGSNRWSKKFKEHGYIIGIMSVLPESNYACAVHKTWFRNDKYDFYWPDFEGLGEQAIENREIYFDHWDDPNFVLETFGYQERYSEYKYGLSQVTGEFQDTLDYWTMARNFNSIPNLNSSFLTVDKTAANNIFAVTTGTYDKMIVQIYHKVDALRKMNYHALPATL
jgi:hypothetical protein